LNGPLIQVTLVALHK